MSSRTPWLTLVLTGAALLLWWFDGTVGRWVEYDRAALASGQLWRAVTGHWTHWSFDHLLWDTAVFAVVGGIFERRFGARRFLFLTFGAALTIGVAIWLLRDDLSRYRGLSGIDCALVVALVAASIRAELGRGRAGWAALQAGVLVAFAAKLIFELRTATAVFVDTTTLDFQVVVVAHVVGGLFGLGLSLGHSTRSALNTPLGW